MFGWFLFFLTVLLFEASERTLYAMVGRRTAALNLTTRMGYIKSLCAPLRTTLRPSRETKFL